MNGEYITACPHDDAVNILRNAGDIVVLTVKHYRAATPFLQKQCKKNQDKHDIVSLIKMFLFLFFFFLQYHVKHLNLIKTMTLHVLN